MRVKDVGAQFFGGMLTAVLITLLATSQPYLFFNSLHLLGKTLPSLATFGFGLACTFALWVVGLCFASTILSTNDFVLFYLTPLTPRRYFSRNLKHMAIALLLVFAVAPVAAAVIYAKIDVFEHSVRVTPLFIANFILTYLLVFFVILQEAISGGLWSKGFFLARVIAIFLLRGVARAMSYMWKANAALALVNFVVLGLGIFFSAPTVASILEQWLLEPLVRAGPVGLLILYALAPFAGLFYFHQPDSPQTAQWLLAALLGLLFAGCLRSIWKGWSVMPAELEQRGFADWTAQREGIEEHEEAAYREEEMRRKPVGHAAADGFPDGAEDSSAACSGEGTLAYDPSLAPEPQSWRHFRFWTHDEARYVSRWTWFVLVAWLVYGFIEFHERSKELKRFAHEQMLLAALILGWWIVMTWRADRVRKMLERLPAFPGRWPLLTWALLRSSPYLWVSDVLAALLVVVLGHLPLWCAVPTLAAALALWASMLAGVWFKASESAGRISFKLFLAFYYAAVCVVLFVSFFAGAASIVGNEMDALPASLVYLFWAGTALLAFVAAIGVLLHWWRSGSQIVILPPVATSLFPNADEDDR